MPGHFTPREVADLAGVPKRTVDEMLQARLSSASATLVRRRAGPCRPPQSPSPISSGACAIGGTRRRGGFSPRPWPARRASGALALRGRARSRARPHLARRRRSGARPRVRERFIHELPRGRAQIRDTHITVAAIQQHLMAGVSIEAVAARYPILTPAVVTLVAAYARSHPALSRRRRATPSPARIVVVRRRAALYRPRRC